jgi:hypothetical protein
VPGAIGVSPRAGWTWLSWQSGVPESAVLIGPAKLVPELYQK